MSDMNPTQADSGKSKNEFWEWTKAIVIALGLALIIRGFLFAPFIVDGHSMDLTLNDGERLIVNKIVYTFGEPERGDIIVFHYDEEKDYIKRVIGLPGDKVTVRDDKLYVNEEWVKEPYLNELKEKYNMEGQRFTESFGEIIVPEGELFVMGDNRPRSRDSRRIGTIEMEQVVGRADFAFWPFASIRFID